MLDQLFTTENFRRVFDHENRKGLDLATRFFPGLEPHTKDIRDKVQEIRDLRDAKAGLGTEEFKERLSKLQSELSSLKSEKSKALDGELEAIALKVQKPTFNLVLEKKLGPKGKDIFCIDGSPETFFVVKQLQINLNKLYGVKQASRHNLVSQVRDTIASKFPYEIVRTDIKDFYETINRRDLLKKLDEDQLLNSSSKKFIRQILASYGGISGNENGIPRGVGVSAYLAELYLRPLDRKIKDIQGIVLYCRYVDDIVSVFARPPAGEAPISYKNSVLEALNESDFKHNEEKTDELHLASPGKKEFEYLGYSFTHESGQLQVGLSSAKIAKYEMRINAAFDDYEKRYSTNPRRAFRDLVARIKFLTGNSRLLNTKSSAVTGVYYNNSLIVDPTRFDYLDKALKAKVSGIKRKTLRNRLKKYTFASGFSERRFHNFNVEELQMIVKVWKHG